MMDTFSRDDAREVETFHGTETNAIEVAFLLHHNAPIERKTASARRRRMAVSLARRVHENHRICMVVLRAREATDLHNVFVHAME
jgi:hypothetical protein